MPQHSYYAMGQFNFVCDQCGLVFKSSEGIARWDGAMVDARCWEPRQPQDFVRGVPDYQQTPWARPRRFLFLETPLDDSALGEVALGDNPAMGGP